MDFKKLIELGQLNKKVRFAELIDDNKNKLKANYEKLRQFTNGFENKSKIDTDEIVREVRGKN
jgi:Mn-dependent DtxR family transcriptional regulator